MTQLLVQCQRISISQSLKKIFAHCSDFANVTQISSCRSISLGNNIALQQFVVTAFKSKMGEHGPLIGAIDEGTSSARFLVFSSISAKVVASHQIEITSIYPQEGWVEQDPVKILHSVRDCIARASESLQEKNIDLKAIAAVGITNQRETTVVWDKLTGEPLHNAIVWLDTRTSSTLEYLLEKVPNKNKNYLQRLCGLPLSPYFSALKIKWLIENVPKVRLAIRESRCCFGTMDSWLIWNLTGGPNGGLYITDASNASRTMLMNIETLQWDPTLCSFFDINVELLPEIRSSSEIYSRISDGILKGVPLSGCLGDQQAALVGQMCLQQGQAKCTYGTGCFLLYNTGTKKVDSSHGLLTTVAYRMGKTAAPVYALEGSVAVAGAAFGWLRDNIKLVKELSEAEPLAHKVSSSGDVYFVPAFSGLYAPYWQPDARGVICGISEETSRTHIIRAALEAVCFQTRDILEAMNKDCGIPLTKLQVDGGMTTNNLLMQLQADLIGITVLRPKMAETTALGAAMAAGNAEGIDIWDLESIKPITCDPFRPMITEDARDIRYSKWKMAIERSFGWDTAGTTPINNA